LRQIAPDEDEFAHALFTLPPFALKIALKHHVNPLKHKTLRLVFKRNDAFQPQNRRSIPRDIVLQPRQEFLRIDFAVNGQRLRLHLLVMIMFWAKRRVVLVSMMLMIMMSVEKFGFQFEDSVEVKGVPAEHGVERQGAVYGPMQLGIRVYRADARLDLAD